MKAFLKNYRQAPRKVRLVANLVKGKKVEEAQAELSFLAKRSAEPLKKLISSAVSNAKQIGMTPENLIIKEMRVDKGLVMKRMMPRAMGRGAGIDKRMSHVTILLAEKVKVEKEKTQKTVKKITKKAK